MKTLRTLLSATALILAAGAANASPALDVGIDSTDSVAPAYHFYPKYPKFPKYKCGYRFGPHYHWGHGFHFGLHYKCKPFYYYY